MTTLHEDNSKSLATLRSSLGPVDCVRYPQQFNTGSGDYTAERQRQAEEDVASVARRVAMLKIKGLLLHLPRNAKVFE